MRATTEKTSLVLLNKKKPPGKRVAFLFEKENNFVGIIKPNFNTACYGWQNLLYLFKYKF